MPPHRKLLKVCARMCAREGVDFGDGVGDGASSEEESPPHPCPPSPPHPAHSTELAQAGAVQHCVYLGVGKGVDVWGRALHDVHGAL